MSTTPFILQDVQKVSYGLNPIDADGDVTVLPAGDSLVVASSDPTIASVVPDAAPAAGFAASGFILGSANLGTVQITGTAMFADGVTPDASIAVASASVQVVAGPAVGDAFTFGTPVAQ